MKVTRYRPNYFSGYPDEEVTVNSMEELLAIPWVGSWEHNRDTDTKFHRLSIGGEKLMAELDDGYTWWVVAMLGVRGEVFVPPEWVDLPMWTAKYRGEEE